MSKATLTIEGFVAKAPEAKDVSGHRVVEVSVPHTPRKLNKQTNQWEDAGETQWYTAAFWGNDGDPILANVTKGSLVTVTGQPKPRGYQKQDGTIAVQTELQFATLGIIPRINTQQAGGSSYGASPASAPVQSNVGAQTGADAWVTPGAFSDDTPF